MKKTIHAIALSLTLCLSIIPVSAQDSIPATDTTVVSGGSTGSIESKEGIEGVESTGIVSAGEQLLAVFLHYGSVERGIIHNIIFVFEKSPPDLPLHFVDNR